MDLQVDFEVKKKKIFSLGYIERRERWAAIRMDCSHQNVVISSFHPHTTGFTPHAHVEGRTTGGTGLGICPQQVQHTGDHWLLVCKCLLICTKTPFGCYLFLLLTWGKEWGGTSGVEKQELDKEGSKLLEKTRLNCKLLSGPIISQWTPWDLRLCRKHVFPVDQVPGA